MANEMVTITRVVTLTYSVPLAHYPGMTLNEAVNAEVDKSIAAVVEELAMAEPGQLASTSVVVCEATSGSRTVRS